MPHIRALSQPSLPRSVADIKEEGDIWWTRDAENPSLGRHDWCEDKCRAFIIRYCQFIPRNYDYADGLKLLYHLLRFAFGDEQLDLATGVIWELIEIEEPPPYPESLFQRWKFAHLHRHDDLSLPHVLHANTISQPAVPTKRLRQWREQHSGPGLHVPSPGILPQKGQHRKSQNTINAFQNCTLAEDSSDSHSQIVEEVFYVSTGGQKPLRYSLTQEVKHRVLWDRSYGRGKLVSSKSLSFESSNEQKTLPVKPPERKPTLERKLSQRLDKMLGWHKTSKKDRILHTIKSLEPPKNFPNGNFARKFGGIDSATSLEDIHILEQKTACQKLVEADQESWRNAWEAANSFRKSSNFHAHLRAEALFRRATSDYRRQPLTAGLFFDCENDFTFEAHRARIPPILNSKEASFHHAKRALRNGRSLPLLHESAREFHILDEAKPKAHNNHRTVNSLSDLPLRNLAVKSETNVVLTEVLLPEASLETLPATTYVQEERSPDTLSTTKSRDSNEVYGPFILVSDSPKLQLFESGTVLESLSLDLA